jgi:hypothetical protein
MSRFACTATVTFGYVVSADSEAEAQALLVTALGDDWGQHISSPYIEEDPRIEETTYDFEVDCIGEIVPG